MSDCFQHHNKMKNRWLVFGVGVVLFAMVLVCVTVPVLTLSRKSDSTTSPIIDTPHGRYQGSIISLADGSSVTRYTGIPFAQPPLGRLRFQPPEPLQRPSTSSHVIDATKFKKGCWSITKKINNPYYDEDCLYLNVYVPMNSNETHNYSTMIWIHGGGFVAGSAFPEPTLFVAKGDVIVVTFTYRLGVFGFLTTNDSALPANNGLLDQLAVMKWVNKNIQYFGGNPNSITIGGESAGAMSAALHAISPMSSPFFNRVIMQSGVASSLFRRNPVEVAREFGNNVGCILDKNTATFRTCLTNVSVEAILLHSKSVNMTDAQKQLDFIWLPVVDGKFIIDDPSKLLVNTSYLKSINAFNKDYLYGFNDNDGSMIVENFLYPALTKPFFDFGFFSDLLDYLVAMKYGSIPSHVSNMIKNDITSFYIGNASSAPRVSKATIIDIAADSIFFAPILNMANSMSKGYKPAQPVCGAVNATSNRDQSQSQTSSEGLNATGKSFVYYFDFCPPKEDECREPCMSHGLQLSFFFPKKEFENNMVRRVSNNFIKLLSYFVNTTQPEALWSVYEKESQKYTRIAPYLSTGSRPFPYRMALWLDNIPKLLMEQLN